MPTDRTPEPIAITGIGCQFPEADDLEAFWDLMTAGREALREVPEERFDVERYYDPRPETPGRIVTRRGGFVEGLREFDASLFGISGREAASMDPQHRKLLEVAWRAVEDAGFPAEGLEGTKTGAFVGSIANEYRNLMHYGGGAVDVYSESGGARAACSGRISHVFGLNGPSLTLDTACSSSLYATHLACESIRRGDSERAIAAGANAILRPEPSIAFSSTGMLAADGRCKFGDASVDGFVRSEGFGAVVLEPLEVARERRSHVYAVIHATGANNDGRSGKGFFLTPSRIGQRRLLEDVYEGRGPDPAAVDYVEAHGTGTSAGDPAEIGAVADALLGAEREDPLLIGSVKTNVGHTEGAAGVAGLIKVALIVDRGRVPPSLNLEEPNPDIDWDELDLEIPTEGRTIEGEEPVGAVSSFGISGSNAHAVLRGWSGPTDHGKVPADRGVRGEYHVLPISAHTADAAETLIESYRDGLAAGRWDGCLRDLCYTAARRRTHRSHRTAAAGRTPDELAAELDRSLEAGAALSESSPREGAVYVFSGQGGQWAGMGRAWLARSATFRRALERCDAAVEELAGWSVRDWLESERALDGIARIQPALFAVQVALAACWREAGVEPTAVAGHSVGEVAAAHVAGVLSVEDAARVVVARSRHLASIAGEGAMGFVGAAPADVEEAIEEMPDGVSVAVRYSPSSTVVSGRPGAVDAVLEHFEGAGVFVRPIEVDVASHSYQVDDLVDDLRDDLSAISPQASEVPVVSTVTGETTAGPTFDASYWARHLSHPVEFQSASETLLSRGAEVFVEIGPHPTLEQPLRQTALSAGIDAAVVPSLCRDEEADRVFADSLGTVFERGCRVDWSFVYPQGRTISTPPYAFDGDEYWFDDRREEGGSTRVRRRSADEGLDSDAHPLLERRFAVGPEDRLTIWEVTVDLATFAYLGDHRLRGSAVFPGAGYTEMVLAAGRRLLETEDVRVSAATFEQILLVPESGDVRMQVAMERVADGRYRAEVYSVSGDESPTAEMETELHFTATVAADEGEAGAVVERLEAAGEIDASRAAVQTGEEHYRELAGQGLENGPSFRAVESVRIDGARADADLRIPSSIEGELPRYEVHPAVLDGWFQLVGSLLLERAGGEAAGRLFLPSRLEGIRLHRPPAGRLHGEAMVAGETDVGEGEFEVDIVVSGERGELIAEIEGLRVRRVEGQEESEGVRELFYETAWRRVRALDEDVSAVLEGTWIVLDDRDGIAGRLVERLEALGADCVRIGPGDEPSRLGASRSSAESVGARAAPIDPPPGADGGPPVEGVVYARSCDWGSDLADHSFERVVDEAVEVVELARRLKSDEVSGPTRLWALTTGRRASTAGTVECPEGGGAGSGAIEGLMRVLRNEAPALEPTTIDLSEPPPARELDATVREFVARTAESEVAVRGGDRYALRLGRFGLAAADRRMAAETIDTGEAFALERSRSGGLEEIGLRPAERRRPQATEVELDVRAAGVNFADVVSAIGALEETDTGIGRLGYGCTGRVVRVGEAVDRFEPGDRAVAIGPTARCFGGYATLDARLAASIPGDQSFVEAATIPTAFLTAWYALVVEGRLGEGETVLVHSASGGVGHAALQIVRAFGAEAVATAGTERKREYLEESFDLIGVSDSRSRAFVDDVREWTGGEGVDLVLNSLTDELMTAGLELLGPFGRFLDLTKSAMFEEGTLDLDRFDRNVAYVGIELTRVAAHGPDLVASMWDEMAPLFEQGVGGLSALPVDRRFPVDEVGRAFRYMSRGEHIGKIVVETDVGEVDVERPMDPDDLFDGAGAYLITGGTGGLGLEVADWMVDRGAGRLVLMSRSGADPEDEDRLEAFRRRGSEVEVVRGDVTDRDDVERAYDVARRGGFELCGVFHLAAVLADATIDNQTRETFQRAMGPKSAGALQLHRTLEAREESVDHFVLFSSAAGLLGSPGQANYAAASTYLDALAVRRRAAGRPAVSIDWGNWAEVGLAASREERGERLESRGLERIGPSEGIDALERALLHETPPQIGIFRADWGRWAEANPGMSSAPMVTHLLPDADEGEGGADRGQWRERIASASEGERDEAILEFVREQVGDVLGVAPSKLSLEKSLPRMGLDSLTIVELRVRLEQTLDVELSDAMIRDADDLRALSRELASISNAGG
ncbi:MAG: SDR family NAD(P)-dependent oxidoreductase [Bradymonadaceae bacterium]